MSKRTKASANYEIYPKRYFDASPTWFAWNNLTATDVNSLRTEPGFEGQQIYFHLNHPIRFVRLVGLLVDVEIKAGKFILLSLDDSSGACVEIKTTIRKVKEDDHAEYPSNTLVDNLDVLTSLGVPTVYINKQTADIGTVIKAKGTLDTFRNTRQLKLERIWTVKDTNEEAKAWSETASWKQDVLAKPWVISREKRGEIDEEIRQNELKERERSKKRKAFDARHAEKKRQKLEKAELKRKREEQKYDAGALKGSNIVPTRVTDS